MLENDTFLLHEYNPTMKTTPALAFVVKDELAMGYIVEVLEQMDDNLWLVRTIGHGIPVLDGDSTMLVEEHVFLDTQLIPLPNLPPVGLEDEFTNGGYPEQLIMRELDHIPIELVQYRLEQLKYEGSIYSYKMTDHGFAIQFTPGGASILYFVS